MEEVEGGRWTSTLLPRLYIADVTLSELLHNAVGNSFGCPECSYIRKTH